MSESLRNQVAVVCGGSGTVGSAIAAVLAEEGASVAVHYRGRRDAAELVVHRIVQAGGRAQAFQADLTDETSTAMLIRDVLHRLGEPSILVNTVHAEGEPKTVFDMAWKDWAVHLDAIKAHFLVCRAVLPAMRERRYGRIVFISGGLSHRYMKGCAAYTTAKAGLEGFCKTLALEEGPSGITVNIVAPGRVDTGAAAGASDPSRAMLDAQRVSAPPLGRDATGRDIADAVSYFASPGAGCITGQTIFVTGGEVMP
jgi:3-oxoacyl-[acyl-carrier protein] reductase